MRGYGRCHSIWVTDTIGISPNKGEDGMNISKLVFSMFEL